ncbi:MAG: o-succinylbenzoate synthase [Chloroflexota bacterium]
MKIERVELYHVSMPLVRPFETSFGRLTHRDAILVAAYADGLIGWGECAALTQPAYSYETVGTAWHVLSDFLIPAVLDRQWSAMEQFLALIAWVRGHPMARAGLQGAAWDLLARRDGMSLAAKLAQPYPQGARARVAVGISLGIQPTVEATLARIEDALAQGYRRIKLKIKPGHDLALAQAARTRFPAVPIMLDANSAYTLADAPLLQQMDDLALLMIEQPLAHDDIVEHSRLQAQLRTPICLDESIHTPAQSRWALEIDAARVINIKPGRVGGLWEGRQIHDICRGRGVPVWCGGMMETGVGRAANLAMASLPGFTLPGDISATARYWTEDIIDELFTLNTQDSSIDVPDGVGLGVTVNVQRLERYRQKSQIFD